MLRHLFTAAIALLWALATWALVTRDLMPAIQEQQGTGYAQTLGVDRLGETSAYEVRAMGRTLGTTRTEVDDAGSYYLLKNHTELTADESLAPGFGGLSLSLETLAQVHPTQGLSRFSMDVASPLFTGKLIGNVDGRDLTLNILPRDGERQQRRFTLPPNALFSSGIGPLLAPRRLEAGLSWTVSLVDPFTGGVKDRTARVEREEEVAWAGGRERAWLVTLDNGPPTVRSWVAPDGRVLRHEVGLGPWSLEMVRIPDGDPDRTAP